VKALQNGTFGEVQPSLSRGRYVSLFSTPPSERSLLRCRFPLLPLDALLLPSSTSDPEGSFFFTSSSTFGPFPVSKFLKAVDPPAGDLFPFRALFAAQFPPADARGLALGQGLLSPFFGHSSFSKLTLPPCGPSGVFLVEAGIPLPFRRVPPSLSDG